MLDPASLLVAALTKALLAAAQGAGSAAGADAYAAIKALILRRYQTAAPEVERLEREPASPQWQEQLAGRLRSLGADRDPELRSMADQLIQLVEDGAWYSPLDEPMRRAGLNAFAQTLERHVGQVTSLRAQVQLDDWQLLSGDIGSADDVPSELRSDIASLHVRMRQIIEQAAVRMENDKYRETENEVSRLPSFRERERAERLIAADKSIRISYETLRLTVDFFSELNNEVLGYIERETSAQRHMQMMFGNAVMLYELADFVTGYIEGFAPGGFAELDVLHRETVDRIRQRRADQAELTRQAMAEGIEPEVREGTLADIRNRDEALDLIEAEWERYLGDSNEFRSKVGEVRAKLPTLRLIRQNARAQLDILELVAMLRFLRQSTDAARAAVASLQGFRLAPLTPTRVSRLLG